MPLCWFKFLDTHLTESYKKHGKDKSWLNKRYHIGSKCMGIVKQWYIDIKQIHNHAAYHGYRQRPITQELTEPYIHLINLPRIPVPPYIRQSPYRKQSFAHKATRMKTYGNPHGWKCR